MSVNGRQKGLISSRVSAHALEGGGIGSESRIILDPPRNVYPVTTVKPIFSILSVNYYIYIYFGYSEYIPEGNYHYNFNHPKEYKVF